MAQRKVRMIDPKELRIGNALKANYSEQIITVDWLVLKHIIDGNVQNVYDNSPVYSPIPLTPEWLERLGFEKWGRDDLPRTVNYHKKWVNIFPANSFCDFEGYGFMWYKPDPDKAEESARVKIKYVHQLQNLFFALTGEEL